MKRHVNFTGHLYWKVSVIKIAIYSMTLPWIDIRKKKRTRNFLLVSHLNNGVGSRLFHTLSFSGTSIFKIRFIISLENKPKKWRYFTYLIWYVGAKYLSASHISYQEHKSPRHHYFQLDPSWLRYENYKIFISSMSFSLEYCWATFWYLLKRKFFHLYEVTF